jgi:predicted Zn-dependent protease
MLSSLVNCRLNLGGSKQAEAAIKEAKECIALNKRYAPGHLGLAKAYLALDEVNHSQKATDALQECLRYNPRNTEAQRMLVRQLQSGHRGKHEATSKKKEELKAASRDKESHSEDSNSEMEKEHKGVIRLCLAMLSFRLDLKGSIRMPCAFIADSPTRCNL